jgi:hypothetical protein
MMLHILDTDRNHRFLLQIIILVHVVMVWGLCLLNYFGDLFRTGVGRGLGEGGSFNLAGLDFDAFRISVQVAVLAI